MSALDDILRGLMGGRGGSGGIDDEQAAGKEQIQQIAQQLGVSESQAAEAVATVLPEVVDQVSLEGELPPEQDLGAAFDQLAEAGAR